MGQHQSNVFTTLEWLSDKPQPQCSAETEQSNNWNIPLLGRPKTISNRYIDRLRELVAHNPKDYGYNRKRWTGQLLKGHLAREFEVDISDRHINRLLQEMGLSARQRRREAKIEKFQPNRENIYHSVPNPDVTHGQSQHLLGGNVEMAFFPIMGFSPSNPLFSATLERVTDAIEITDAEARFLYVNSAFEKTTGYGLKEVIGKTPATILRSGMHEEAFYREMFRTVESGRIWQGNIVSKHKDGFLIDFDTTLTPILSPQRKLTHIIAVKREISGSSCLQDNTCNQVLQHLQSGLVEPKLFYDRLNMALANLYRHPGLLGVIFLDLDCDEFDSTKINGVGGYLCKEVVNRVRHCLRGNDTLTARDEGRFMLLLSHLNRWNDAMQVSQRILAALESIFKIEGNEFYLSGRIGIALYPQHGSDAETLLKNADSALHFAKQNVQSNYRFYEPALDTGSKRITIVPWLGAL
jgi:PAS domain S-box-containing protein/diguanylate cyclase (GGDEF)-like protein